MTEPTHPLTRLKTKAVHHLAQAFANQMAANVMLGINSEENKLCIIAMLINHAEGEYDSTEARLRYIDDIAAGFKAALTAIPERGPRG